MVCPDDVTIQLPIGAKDTTLPIERLSVKDLDIDNLVTEPNGVLSGDYRFVSKPLSTRITIKSFNPSQSCEFHVTVEDTEPPKVKYCPKKDVYVSLNAYRGPVTWKEPEFEDNVAVTKKLQNLQNGKVLGEQVYYVDYAVFDEFKNEAGCRFFVHVKGISNLCFFFRLCFQTLKDGGGTVRILLGSKSRARTPLLS